MAPILSGEVKYSPLSVDPEKAQESWPDRIDAEKLTWDTSELGERVIGTHQRCLLCHRQNKTTWLGRINIFLFVTLMIALISLAWTNWHTSNNAMLQAVSYYSPMFSRYDIEFEHKVVAGTLFNEDTLSEHDLLLRRFPDKEVDKAWTTITDVGVITITSDEVKRLGKEPEKVVKVPSDWGMGGDLYLAQQDGQHVLHCLNAVRRYAYSEYYYPHINSSSHPGRSPFSAFDDAHRAHCLHILLQTLTCNPSMDLITHKWVETQDYPFPDFAVNKKCINHNQMLDWKSKNQISTERWMDMAARGPGQGETVFPMTKQFKLWSESEDAKAHAGHGHK